MTVLSLAGMTQEGIFESAKDCVRYHRNVLGQVPKNKMAEVSAMLKAVHAQEDKAAAKGKSAAVAGKLRDLRLSAAAQVFEASIDETLAYMAFPREHWRRIRTNNPLERLNREIRRRTRVVGNFLDGHSALMLVSARLRHLAGTKWGQKSYLDMSLLITPGQPATAA